MKFLFVLFFFVNKILSGKLKKYNNFCGEENILVLYVVNGKLIFFLCLLFLLVI